MTTHKYCPGCHKSKPVEDFCTRNGKPNTYCKECAAAKARAYRAKPTPVF